MNYSPRRLVVLSRAGNLTALQNMHRVSLANMCVPHTPFDRWTKPQKETEEAFQDAFHEACCGGHLPVMQWLVDVRPTIHTGHSLVTACRHGQLAAAQWLHERNLARNVPIDYCSVFHQACVYGHLSVVQWLGALEDRSSYYDTGFNLACDNARLAVAQWLWEQPGWKAAAEATWAPPYYTYYVVPMYGRDEEAWHALAAQVLATHPEWDEKRARRLGLRLQPTYLLK